MTCSYIYWSPTSPEQLPATQVTATSWQPKYSGKATGLIQSWTLSVCWCYSCYNLPSLPKFSPVCDGRIWDPTHLSCSVVSSGEAWQAWVMQGHNSSVSNLLALLEVAATEAAKSPLPLWFIVWNINLNHPSHCPSKSQNSLGASREVSHE